MMLAACAWPASACPKEATITSIISMPSSQWVHDQYRKLVKATKLTHTHALATEDVCEPTERELPKHGAYWGGNLDPKVFICTEYLSCIEDQQDSSYAHRVKQH